MKTVCDPIIDEIVEWIGLKYTKSQIKRKLKEARETLSYRIMEDLITLARMKIRQMYKIDPIEFKGSSIEFYCHVIRGTYKIRYKILCQERLDKLLGLEHISSENPDAYADRVLAAMQEADSSVTGDETEEQEIKENYTDIFSEVPLDSLEPHLKHLAENLSADK